MRTSFACWHMVLNLVFFYKVEKKVLNIGEELRRETIPLRMGSRLYRLQGIKPSTWYEVKISYPASIPASFSIQLKRGDLELPLNRNRRSLNTEKLIFKSENDDWNDQGGMYVLVIVEPEGVVVVPKVQEREDIIFNIVCHELAWRVVGFVVVCIVLGGDPLLSHLICLHRTLISSTLFAKSSRSECFERFLNMTPVVFEDHLMPWFVLNHFWA